jgi:hypothetical protein
MYFFVFSTFTTSNKKETLRNNYNFNFLVHHYLLNLKTLLIAKQSEKVFIIISFFFDVF